MLKKAGTREPLVEADIRHEDGKALKDVKEQYSTTITTITATTTKTKIRIFLRKGGNTFEEFKLKERQKIDARKQYKLGR